ncbi:ribonuclease H-like domain-containing protein [Tanacetum coccineum]
MTPSTPPSYDFLDPSPSLLLTSIASNHTPHTTNNTTPLQTQHPKIVSVQHIPQSPTHQQSPNIPTPAHFFPQGPTSPAPSPQQTTPAQHSEQTTTSPPPFHLHKQPQDQPSPQPANAPPHTHLMITRSQSDIIKLVDRLSLNNFSISHIPKNPFAALKDPQWRNAVYDEYNVLVKNSTWLLVPRLAGVNMVCSMWLFKQKFHADGTLSRYKDRLVANGSSQQLGVVFDETFSLIVKPATIHMVLSLDVSRKWTIHQLHVKNAFLNGDLSETVYMHQPPGFVDTRCPNHVCRLQRSLYGLKQTPRA